MRILLAEPVITVPGWAFPNVRAACKGRPTAPVAEPAAAPEDVATGDTVVADLLRAWLAPFDARVGETGRLVNRAWQP